MVSKIVHLDASIIANNLPLQVSGFSYSCCETFFGLDLLGRDSSAESRSKRAGWAWDRGTGWPLEATILGDRHRTGWLEDLGHGLSTMGGVLISFGCARKRNTSARTTVWILSGPNHGLIELSLYQYTAYFC
jgi:hypothetical protein